MSFETRSGKRHPVSSSAQFSIHESTAGGVKLDIPSASIKGALIDINSCGCGLDSPYLIPPNTLIKIEIDSTLFADELKQEHRGPIIVTGNVRSCVMKSVGRYRLGVCFKEIKREDAVFLDNFLKAKELTQP